MEIKIIQVRLPPEHIPIWCERPILPVHRAKSCTPFFDEYEGRSYFFELETERLNAAGNVNVRPYDV